MYKVLEALKSINYKDVFTRAMWTFLQAFLAVFILAGESLVDLLFAGSWEALWTATLATALAAIAAGLSAVKTIVIELIRNIKSQSEA